MKLKKKDLLEIIDTNGELIGSKNIPEVDPNAETQANNTTDYNQKVGTQPFRYDMLGRFGFTLMPFMEGVEENQGQKELMNDLIELMHERFVDLLNYYYRNPNKLKPDYRKISAGEYSEESKKFDEEWARKIIKVVEKHFENAFKESDTIDEAKVVEDKMVDKKEDEIFTKTDDNEVREKKLEKIAGLINKLEKKDIDKLINLLERSNG